jgi:hypothetical protein
MRRARILAAGLTEQEVADLKELCLRAGFTDEELDAVPVVAAPIADCDDELLLVPLSLAVRQAPQLEGELIKAHSGARRTICVWPEGTDPQSTPPEAVRKYAYSIVPWDADKLRRAAADNDVLIFEAPTGETLPTVPVERNLCVDEEAK